MILNEIVVVTGEYVLNGETKKRWRTIGHLHETQDGRQYITLDPVVNLAAIPRREGDDRVYANLFEPKQGRGDSAAPKAESRAAANGKPAPTVSDFQDDVPF